MWKKNLKKFALFAVNSGDNIRRTKVNRRVRFVETYRKKQWAAVIIYLLFMIEPPHMLIFFRFSVSIYAIQGYFLTDVRLPPMIPRFSLETPHSEIIPKSIEKFFNSFYKFSVFCSVRLTARWALLGRSTCLVSRWNVGVIGGANAFPPIHVVDEILETVCIGIIFGIARREELKVQC